MGSGWRLGGVWVAESVRTLTGPAEIGRRRRMGIVPCAKRSQSVKVSEFGSAPGAERSQSGADHRGRGIHQAARMVKPRNTNAAADRPTPASLRPFPKDRPARRKPRPEHPTVTSINSRIPSRVG